MGLSADGFTRLAADGSGNSMGLGGETPSVSRWYPIDWPALSGSGVRPPAASIRVGYSGNHAINWFDPAHPSHIRNEVNDAYRETLEKRPPLRLGTDAEVIVVAAAGADVWARQKATGWQTGVRADAKGRAWFRSLDPGVWLFSSGGKSAEADLAPRGASAIEPGFAHVRKVVLK